MNDYDYELTRDYLGLRDPKDILPLQIEVIEDFGINHEYIKFSVQGQDGFYRYMEFENVILSDLEIESIKESFEIDYLNHLNNVEV